ncbi:hypothetical protein [Methylobacterium nigriterrae]|uniref:hypothetical protein n=1 Tax=Methylobacterium nigriterrae TaxID=3127512 RepID=UPI003013AB28
MAALGAPIQFAQPVASAAMLSVAPRSYESRIYSELRPHIITATNDGILDDKGAYGLTEAGLQEIVTQRMPRRMAAWTRKRVVLYAHGGLVAEDAAIQTVASNLDALMMAEVYPLSFIWRSDALSTLGNILRDAFARRRSEGILDAAKDFMLDRIDDTLEPLARFLGGKALWDEMKENATRATTRAKGAARLTAGHLVALEKAGTIDEIHLVGHSAGAIFQAHLASHLAGQGVPIKSVTLWAPACTMALFDALYRPLIEGKQIEAFDLYTLDDATEQDDDCANIYHKSLLYLVRAALEETAGIFGGTPLLGLERDARSIPAAFWRTKRAIWHLAPGPDSKALHHGDFDNDPTTLLSTLRRITAQDQPVAVVQAAVSDRTRSRGANRQLRRRLDLVPAR